MQWKTGGKPETLVTYVVIIPQVSFDPTWGECVGISDLVLATFDGEKFVYNESGGRGYSYTITPDRCLWIEKPTFIIKDGFNSITIYPEHEQAVN